MKQDLENREDVNNLVVSFYDKVRNNKEIGTFFNNSIKDWDSHLEKLTDFWESNLFFKPVYSGNPKQAHIQVDRDNNNKIDAYHFGIWLNLWFKTLDELFEGPLTERAKNNARKMSSHFYLKIFQSR